MVFKVGVFIILKKKNSEYSNQPMRIEPNEHVIEQPISCEQVMLIGLPKILMHGFDRRWLRIYSYIITI